MTPYFCDLHIHSCLSPCADDDMTPANIAGMAALNGLRIVALTDHNSAANCPPFFAHAARLGLIPVGGMELTTAEDIHAVCLFPDLDGTMAFDAFVAKRRCSIPNRADIFGHQYLTDEEDAVCGEIEELLIPATDLSLAEAHDEVTRRGGVLYPAHIDRTSNGILAVLGTFPPTPLFTAYELHDGGRADALTASHPLLSELVRTVSSDAHHLWDIAEADFALSLPDDPSSPDRVRRELIALLRGERG